MKQNLRLYESFSVSNGSTDLTDRELQVTDNFLSMACAGIF